MAKKQKLDGPWKTASKQIKKITANESTFPENIPTHDEIRELKSEFNAIFGKQGKELRNALIISDEFRGKEDDPHHDYTGTSYSLPLANYLMERAVDPEISKLDAYRRFIDMVNYYHKKIYDKDPEQIPSQAFIENITAPALTELKKLDNRNQTSNYDDNAP